MNKHWKTPTGSREWTKEEMMSYLDWNRSENERLDAQVAEDVVVQLFLSRRGIEEIWRECVREIKEQQELYIAR